MSFAVGFRILSGSFFEALSFWAGGVLVLGVPDYRTLMASHFVNTWSLHDPLRMVGHYPKYRGHGPIF